MAIKPVDPVQSKVTSSEHTEVESVSARGTVRVYHPSRRTFGFGHPSRRTFGRGQPVPQDLRAGPPPVPSDVREASPLIIVMDPKPRDTAPHADPPYPGIRAQPDM